MLQISGHQISTRECSSHSIISFIVINSVPVLIHIQASHASWKVLDFFL